MSGGREGLQAPPLSRGEPEQPSRPCDRRAVRSGKYLINREESEADRITWDVKAEKAWGVEGVGIRGGAYSKQLRSWRACFVQAA